MLYGVTKSPHLLEMGASVGVWGSGSEFRTPLAVLTPTEETVVGLALVSSESATAPVGTLRFGSFVVKHLHRHTSVSVRGLCYLGNSLSTGCPSYPQSIEKYKCAF